MCSLWLLLSLLVITLVPYIQMSVFGERISQNVGMEKHLPSIKSQRNQEVRAIWVEAIGQIRPLDSQSKIETMVADAVELQATDLFVQVYKAGQSWYRSTLADHRPYQAAMINGYDPLQKVLELAHSHGIRVHAWVNMFNLAENGEAEILKRYGDDILIRDNLLVSSREYIERARPPGDRSRYFALDTPGLWIDPGSNRVRRYMVQLVAELLKNYPDLDGLHLDYFRYPYLIPIRPASSIPFGFDFGYGGEAVKTFSSQSGINKPFYLGRLGELEPTSSSVAAKWDDWRRERLSGYLKEFRRLLKPNQALSSAVMAWIDRAYMNSLQDWTSWMAEERLDAVAIMAYTKDDKHFAKLVKQASSFKTDNTLLLAGVGAWLLNANDVNKQKLSALKSGADGVVLFSYGNLRARQSWDFAVLKG